MMHHPDPLNKPLSRREDDALLRGKARFGQDLDLPEVWHIAFVRSPQAHAHLNGIDASAALALEGVKAVLTHLELGDVWMPDINPLLPLLLEQQFPVLASTTVSYVGQPVAVVVADSLSLARHAAALVTLQLEPLPALLDFAEEAPQLTHTQHMAGTLPNTEPTAQVKLMVPRVSAMPMEPRACSANWHTRTQTMTAWVATQAPSRAQADLAKVLGISKKHVHLICPEVGGAFGARASVSPEDLLVALTTKHLGHAVRWISTRSEDFSAGMQGRGARLRGSLWVCKEGQFVGLSAHLHFTLGAWMPFSGVVPLRNAARILPGPYVLRDLQVNGVGTSAHAAPVNIYRGAGRPEAALLMETLIDIAARRLRLDPISLRMKNLIPEHAMPYLTATGETLDSGAYAQALHKACEHFNYPHEREEQTRRRSQGECVGVGVAMYLEPCGQGWESARVTWHEDGRIDVASGSPAQGQGHASTFAHLATQALGCSPDQIQIFMGDSELCPEGIGALASRSTAIGGSAIVQACQAAKKLRDEGSPFPIIVEEKFHAKEAWSYGCVLVRIQLDLDTGKSTIERITWVDDAGHIVQPELAHGQLVGGAAQGLGQALMERVVYDDHGQLITGSLMDYAIPRADNMPAIDIFSLNTASPHNLLGAKGVGEAGCIGVPAAVMNATKDALSPWGEFDLQLPLTSEQIWRVTHAQLEKEST